MGEYVTLSERKAAKVAAMKAAVAELEPLLTQYAHEHGGSFVLFGSAARGDMRQHSDVDILVDFPLEAELDAWLFAETLCFERGLRPDIHIRAWCADRFVRRVQAEGHVLR